MQTLVDQSTPFSRTDEYDSNNPDHHDVGQEQMGWPYAIPGIFHFTNQANNGPGGHGAKRLKRPLMRLYTGSTANSEIVIDAFKTVSLQRPGEKFGFDIKAYNDFDAFTKSFQSESAQKMSETYHKKNNNKKKKKKKKEKQD